MSRQIFVNLPVADLDKSIAFFTALGFKFNPQFTDSTATCMIISDTIYAMLLTHAKFKMFAPKDICDTSKANEVLITLSCESRAEVDSLVQKAVAAGGHSHSAAQDHGFMYDHDFIDLDGHAWGVMYMDLSAMPAQP